MADNYHVHMRIVLGASLASSCSGRKIPEDQSVLRTFLLLNIIPMPPFPCFEAQAELKPDVTRLVPKKVC